VVEANDTEAVQFLMRLPEEPELYWDVFVALGDREDSFVVEVLAKSVDKGIKWAENPDVWGYELDVFLTRKRGRAVLTEWQRVSPRQPDVVEDVFYPCQDYEEPAILSLLRTAREVGLVWTEFPDQWDDELDYFLWDIYGPNVFEEWLKIGYV
jgi:hypothetical protein